MLGLDWAIMEKWFPYLLEGAGRTVLVSVLAMALGTAIGVLAGIGRTSRNPLIYRPIIVYIDFIRGTPLLIQIMLMHFAVLPTLLGRSASGWVSGGLSLSINAGAYIAEIVRAGIQSIDKGQMEAARSLGMTPNMAMRYVILPQAFRNIIPPLGNEFIIMLKDSSLLFAVAFEELATRAKLMIGRTFRTWEALLPAALLYLVMTVVFTNLLGRLERRLRPLDRRS